MELAAINFSWYRDDDDEALRCGAVLLAGKTEAGASILLGGSARHVVGSPRFDRDMAGTYSDAVALRNLLADHLDDVDDFSPYGGNGDQGGLSDALHYVHLLVSGREGTALGECEFLAKTLQRGTNDGKPVTLATPLFVAIE
jgi:hypothetical protein